MRFAVRRIAGFTVADPLAVTGVALGARPRQYGATTSQKEGGAPLRIRLRIGHGAGSDLQLREGRVHGHGRVIGCSPGTR